MQKKLQKMTLGFLTFVGLLGLTGGAHAGSTHQDLTVTTFNIEWFGLGGDLRGSPEREQRDSHIREFLKQNYSDTDVFAFQEIVDIERFQTQVLDATWTCQSYTSKNPRHQHIVICLRKGLVFGHEPGDDNDIIEEVTNGAPHRIRPALRLLIKKRGGPVLARMIAVHFKAFPDQSEVRMKQSRALAQVLAKSKLRVPTILLGDFNTYRAPQNGQKQDDEKLMNAIFKEHDLGFVHVPNPAKNTYRKRDSSEKLDHIWISSSIEIAEPLTVWGACNSDPRGTDGFENIDYFNEHVSDHCPLSVRLRL